MKVCFGFFVLALAESGVNELFVPQLGILGEKFWPIEDHS